MCRYLDFSWFSDILLLQCLKDFQKRTSCISVCPYPHLRVSVCSFKSPVAQIYSVSLTPFFYFKNTGLYNCSTLHISYCTIYIYYVWLKTVSERRTTPCLIHQRVIMRQTTIHLHSIANTVWWKICHSKNENKSKDEYDSIRINQLHKLLGNKFTETMMRIFNELKEMMPQLFGKAQSEGRNVKMTIINDIVIRENKN